MTYWVVIPARFGSTRLPGKALLDIAGKPMLQHVYERACESAAQRVIVATDDERIASVARGFGADVAMTAANHESGTDRLHEVAAQYALPIDAVLVNVQGDEPLIPPALIEQVATKLTECPDAGMATLCEPITTLNDVLDPNIVKVVRDDSDRALYFSRAPIPWSRSWDEADIRAVQSSQANNSGERAAIRLLDEKEGQWWRHIGVYAYRVGFLNRFVSWPKASLESIECLEQLRAMHHGVDIRVATAACSFPGGVDTEQDLQRIRNIMLQSQDR